MKLSANKEKLHIAISGDFSVEEIETMIADLAGLRAKMVPPIPVEVPTQVSTLSHSPNLSIQDDPYFAIRRLTDGRFRFWLRNQGLGWMIFNIPVEKSCSLRDYLIANTPTAPIESNFFIEKVGDGGATH